MLYYAGSTTTSASDAERARQVASELVGCRMTSSAVTLVDGGHDRDAAALNLVMMTAYLDHAVDFYFILFAGTPTQHARFVEQQYASVIYMHCGA